MIVTRAGNLWIYPSLVCAPTAASVDASATAEPPSLILGSGTTTVGADAYQLSFHQGELKVETLRYSDPFPTSARPRSLPQAPHYVLSGAPDSPPDMVSQDAGPMRWWVPHRD